MTDSTRVNAGMGWGIAVVHGVGSPAPRDTLMHVCKAIQQASPGVTFAAAPKRTPDGLGGFVDVLEGKAGEGRVCAAEAYWGDISLVRNRLTTLVRALFINLFGLRYICQRALANAPLLVRALSVFPFQVIRGVIIPAHLVALGLAVPIGMRLWWTSGSAEPMSQDGYGAYLTTYDDMFLALCLGYAAIGISLAAWMKLSRGVRSRPWDIALSFAIIALLSALFSGPSLLRHTSGLPTLHDWIESHSVPGWVSACNREVDYKRPDGVSLLPAIVDVLTKPKSISQGFCLLIAKSTPVTEVVGIGKYLAINEFVGDALFLVISIDVLFLLVFAVLHIALAARAKSRAVFLALTATMLVVVLTIIILEPVDLVTRLVQYWGETSIPTYWYELLLIPWIVAVAGAITIVVLYRSALVRRNGQLNDQPTYDGTPVQFPRLIVSNIFQITVIISTLVLILALMVSTEIPKELYSVPVSIRLGAAPALLVLVTALIISSEQLRCGLNFAMDVVNHFTEPARDYPVRRQIADRFLRALKVLLEDRTCRRLIIIAHSQGTVITLEALLHDLWEQHLKGKVDSLTIMTFGSPWSHIYQHYFAVDYPEAASARLQTLAGVKYVKWFNVFRTDDAVGTEVSMSLVGFPVGVAIAPGGHTRYWEKGVLDRELLNPFLPAAISPDEILLRK